MIILFLLCRNLDLQNYFWSGLMEKINKRADFWGKTHAKKEKGDERVISAIKLPGFQRDFLKKIMMSQILMLFLLTVCCCICQHVHKVVGLIFLDKWLNTEWNISKMKNLNNAILKACTFRH